MRTVWNFATSGRFTFGRGAVAEFADSLARKAQKAEASPRVFVLSDQNLAGCGHPERLRKSLADAGVKDVAVCDAGQAEPSIEDANRCIELAREFEPSLIVGLGGGSNLDLAKITATVLAHGGKPQDYFGFDRIPGPVLPLAAIPTTAGTGSEVSHSAVLTDTAQAIKVSTLSQFLRPAIAVVDPDYSDSAPPQVTADSGIDALVHAIEAYTARSFDQMADAPSEARAYEGSHPLGKLLAAEAIRLIGNNLRQAVHEPKDHAARDAMALAASYAGMAFSNCGVALVHGLEYPIGALVHCSHGAGNGCLLPFVMQYNLPQRTREIAEIGHMLQVSLSSDDQEAKALETIDAIIELRSAIGIPMRISELGVNEQHLPAIARKTAGIERLMMLNPRTATEESLLEILKAAL